MGALTDARTALADRLGAAGLPVTLDPRVQPPAVLVDVPVGEATELRTWSYRHVVKLCAVPPGDADALTWLLDTLAVVLGVVGPGAEWRPGTVTVADKDLPAYIVEAPASIPNPNC